MTKNTARIVLKTMGVLILFILTETFLSALLYELSGSPIVYVFNHLISGIILWGFMGYVAWKAWKGE